MVKHNSSNLLRPTRGRKVDREGRGMRGGRREEWGVERTPRREGMSGAARRRGPAEALNEERMAPESSRECKGKASFVAP